MLATIPYFDVPTLSIPLGPLGPLVIDSWATLVAIGFIVGLEVARARGLKLGLDVKDIVDGLVFTVGMGFVGGHLVHVLAYNPQQLEEQGIMALVRIWAGFSSTGGFIGAVLGIVLFYRLIRKRPFWPHADTIMFGFPFAWVFGRLGCFSAHDHIGRTSDFFLAVQFPGSMGARHDLGLYEALWTMVISAVFFFVSRRDPRPGTFTAIFCLMYAPARFGLDFLRNEDVRGGSDVRWAGLTPAQYGMIAMALAGVGLILWLKRGAAPSPPPAPLAPPATPPPDDRSSEP